MSSPVSFLFDDETPDYGEAVRDLYIVAMNQNGGGALAAAQVLLSCHNANEYLLQPARLGNLDAANRELAFIVLEGRVMLRTLPHEMLKNGQDLFDKLQVRYKNLQFKNMTRAGLR